MLPFQLLFVVDMQPEFIISTVVSPDLKHEIEAIGSNAGPLGSQTEVQLYKIYSVPIIRRLEKAISKRDWSPSVKVKWINNNTFEIQGERFDLSGSKWKVMQSGLAMPHFIS